MGYTSFFAERKAKLFQIALLPELTETQAMGVRFRPNFL